MMPKIRSALKKDFAEKTPKIRVESQKQIMRPLS